VGLDGQRKMSKSFSNYVGITEPPNEMFGKIMSIPDELMWPYYELLTDFSLAEIAKLRQEVSAGKAHPMNVKTDLALKIVSEFHGSLSAAMAREEFERFFRRRESPEKAPVLNVPLYAWRKDLIPETTRIKAVRFLAKLAHTSRSEMERLIKQGAVEIDGSRITDTSVEIDLGEPRAFLLRVGKFTIYRVNITP
jgi:tyrosyl-tRNA synthetase